MQVRLKGSDGNVLAGFEIWHAGAEEIARIYGDRGDDPGAGHRSEHGTFFRSERSRVESACVSSAGTACSNLLQDDRYRARANQLSQFRRLAAPDENVRFDGDVPQSRLQ